MNKLPALISVSDFRLNVASVIKRTQKSEDGLTVITQEGRAAAVLLSLAAYDRIQQIEREREQLLRQLIDSQEAKKEEKLMARKWKSTNGKKLLEVLARRGWVLSNRGTQVFATRGTEEHLITFTEEERLSASLVELWGNWMGLKSDDFE